MIAVLPHNSQVEPMNFALSVIGIDTHLKSTYLKSKIRFKKKKSAGQELWPLSEQNDKL